MERFSLYLDPNTITLFVACRQTGVLSGPYPNHAATTEAARRLNLAYRKTLTVGYGGSPK